MSTLLSELEKHMLEAVADLHDIPAGAYNIRRNGEGAARQSTEHIQINPKTDKPGIDIIVAPGTKNESIHIPVIITEAGVEDLVYNDFVIGDDCDVLIVAGCGIHNDGGEKSQHNGIHSFQIGKNCRVKYVEKHYGEGKGTGGRILNPVTHFDVGENSYVEVETVQISGVDSTDRDTKVRLNGDNSQALVTERLLTDGVQAAISQLDIELYGKGTTGRIISRSVARDHSHQEFNMRVAGHNDCWAHIQCDSIIMEHGCVRAIPECDAMHPDCQLIHEAAIGKIAGEQIIKLMSLGLTSEEAEEAILAGFLK